MTFVIGDAASSGSAGGTKSSATPNFDQAALSTSTNPSLHFALADNRMPRSAMIIP